MCLSSTKRIAERNILGSCVNFENVIKRVNNNNEPPDSSISSLSKKSLKFYVGPENLEIDVSKSERNEFKKSSSFAGFGRFLGQNNQKEGSQAFTRDEINKMFDSKKQEPLNSLKLKIKEYAEKYKYIKTETTTVNAWYKEIFLHAQPAHVIVMLAFLYLTVRLFPDARRSQTEASTITRLLYVASVSAVSGTQFWMTFFSGIALFLTVSRHTFGKVQLVLFPLYFLVNSVLMLIVIITYTQHNPTHMWDIHQLVQGIFLVTSFITNLVIRVYLAPVLTKLIKIKMTLEEEAGMGKEIGSSHPGVLQNCPHYMRLHKAFRKTHMIIATGNIISVAATTMHLYYIATKLCAVNL